MFTSLISTKYNLPPATQGRVQRSHLLAYLDELLIPGKRLALVSALAGSSKTTLVRAWVEQYYGTEGAAARLRVAWLSLDEDDNNEMMGLHLTPTDDELLVARSEGWTASVYKENEIWRT